MPSCSIVQCGAKKNPNQPHLTMHRFPKNEVLRQKWLEIIGMENIKPGLKVPRVCSLHFAESSFNKTLDVIRLRDDSVPSIHLVPSKKTLGPVLHEIKIVEEQAFSMMTQPTLPVKHLDQIYKEIEAESITSENAMPSTSGSLPAASAPGTSTSPDLSMELDNQAEIKVCRVCLALDVKMFDMKDFNLIKMFQNITGISVHNTKESILYCVCWECAARLTAAAAFRNKAQLSDALLKDIANMNKSDIAKLKHMYRSFLKSPLINKTVLTSSYTGCGDNSPDHMKMEIFTNKTEFEDDESLVNSPMVTDVGSSTIAENNSNFETKDMKNKILSAHHFDDSMSSHRDDNENAIENSEVYNNNNVLNEVTVMSNTPLSENDFNIQINYMKNEIFSALTDKTENSKVYFNNNNKVLNKDDDIMTNETINDDCYVVIVVGDDENSPELDVVGDTANESLSEEDSQSLEEASVNIAKKMTIRKVETSCEQGNWVNDGVKQKIIASKDKCLSGAELSEEPEKSLTVQNIKTINRLNKQLTSCLSSKQLKPITTRDKSPPTCNGDVKDEHEILLTEDITDQDDDGLNGPEVNDPVFDDHGFDDDGIDTNVLYDKNDPLEEEYVLSDKENDSSDNSLPLEKCNAKNTRKRKEKADKTATRVKKIKVPTEPKIGRPKNPSNYYLIETLFTITDLTLEEQIAEIVERQESSNYKNCAFKCSVCFKGFVDKDAYNSHMSRHTDQCGEYECKICKMHFKNPQCLQKHNMISHTQTYSCKQCTYVTKNRHTATRHARWHKGTKYRCPHCPDVFEQFSTYMGHLRIKHPSDFVCELCGYSFVSAKGREQHKNLKHRLDNVQIPEDGPLCELCNVRFVSTEAHKRHLSISAKHNTDKDSGEPKQAKRERKRRTLDNDGDIEGRRRINRCKMQKVEGPIPCEQCGMQLEGTWAYHSHFRRMHPDKNRTNYPTMRYPCMCEVCGGLFQCYTQLEEHILVHKGDTPWKCDLCSKTFRTKSNLKLHQRLHSQVRPSYECAICGKNFANHSNRRRHMLIHTGVRPFKCELCGKSFKVPGEKRSHINFVHLKKPWPKRKRQKRRSETKQDRTSTTRYSHLVSSTVTYD